MKNNPFFMVFVEGQQTPTYKHTTIESAEIEAKRLARTLKKKVFVLCSIKAIELNEFKVEDYRDDDSLPF
jgi:hypothetical protein